MQMQWFYKIELRGKNLLIKFQKKVSNGKICVLFRKNHKTVRQYEKSNINKAKLYITKGIEYVVDEKKNHRLLIRDTLNRKKIVNFKVAVAL